MQFKRKPCQTRRVSPSCRTGHPLTQIWTRLGRMRRRLRERGDARGCALRSLLGANRKAPGRSPFPDAARTRDRFLRRFGLLLAASARAPPIRERVRAELEMEGDRHRALAAFLQPRDAGRRSSSTARVPSSRNWRRRCGRPGPWHRSSAGRERAAPPIFRRPAPAARRFSLPAEIGTSLPSPKVLCWSTQV
jgi:hypothetical protein